MFQMYLYSTVTGEKKDTATWTEKQEEDYAHALLTKGLVREAAAAFENYLTKSTAKSDKLAQIGYRLGTIYMDLLEYEKALATFYKAELLSANSSFKEEMNQKIVVALENLGMSSQAQYELEARTSVGNMKKKEGSVVARIGKDTITDAEIDRALNQLPAALRKQFEGGENRLKVIRDYVAQEVLYRKARRLGYDKTPEIREAVEATKKQIAVQKLLQEKIEKEVNIDGNDVERFYQAQKQQYLTPAAVKVSYVKMDDVAKKEEMLEILSSGKGEKVDSWIGPGQSFIPGIGDAGDIVDTLLVKEKGALTDPLKVKDVFYIFSIDERREKYQKQFNEVKQQVEYEYTMKKQQELTQKLLEEALEEQEVEIYPVRDTSGVKDKQ